MTRRMKAGLTVKQTDWRKFGYTKKQARYVTETYGSPSVLPNPLRCICKTCKLEYVLETRVGVLDFLSIHKGHKTVVEEVK
jgi:hypothetical protein